jgi:hypothetical protein
MPHKIAAQVAQGKSAWSAQSFLDSETAEPLVSSQASVNCGREWRLWTLKQPLLHTYKKIADRPTESQRREYGWICQRVAKAELLISTS